MSSIEDLKINEIRKNKYLDESEKFEINQFTNKRFSGTTNHFYNTAILKKKMPPLISYIDRKKRNIFLFSNVYWDVGLSECGGLYPGVLEWVISTIESVKDSTDCHLYIKPHPSEIYEIRSSKGVIDEIYAKFPKLPQNVTIIYPEMKILTYELFPYIDLGVVFNGTLGLEMLLENIPVIACGKTPYSSIDLVSEPKSIKEYSDFLLGKRAACSPKKEDVLRFAYFYFIKTLIPWHLTDVVWADESNSLKIKSVKELMPKANFYLDHICDNIVSSNDAMLDNWALKVLI